MSPAGALTVALASLIVLGAGAAWLVNVPLWAIGILVLAGIGVMRAIIRRVTRRTDRQKTEA